MTGITVDPMIVVAAFRYALGRSTYVVTDVTDCIQRNASTLPRPDRALMVREIREAISGGRAGMSMDVAAWERTLERLDKEQP
jgi:hypothetical protein